ncbi:unnamed protein product [Porites lobata]|uniref:UDP-glucose 4-epimerase n=1 Tax=Porites lobata TaxID=104759 RepID=A0ABN8NIF9_9CNID|nr:unnamed protein product [Porites lobata]
MTSKCILVTGGAGYIGTHTVVELIIAGYDVVIVDNFVNAFSESVKRVEEITGRKIPHYSIDLLNREALKEVFKKHEFYAVIHLAALKAVGESVEIPLRYYHNNITGSVNLLECMKECGVWKFVFSSSATVYGTPQNLPISEDHPVGIGITNPYGRSKFFIEEIIKDLCKAEKNMNAVLLRYFNPVGAHKSGRIGEDPQGIPNNLMPYLLQVAVGRRPHLNVFGNDYETTDGTGVRDYIHVVDLAVGHVSALKKLEENCGCKVYNLGTGRGYSVLEMVKAVEKASGKTVEYKICPRREGDVASMFSNASLAEKELGWKAERGLDEMCEDSWRWQVQNPQGFNTAGS